MIARRQPSCDHRSEYEAAVTRAHLPKSEEWPFKIKSGPVTIHRLHLPKGKLWSCSWVPKWRNRTQSAMCQDKINKGSVLICCQDLHPAFACAPQTSSARETRTGVIYSSEIKASVLLLHFGLECPLWLLFGFLAIAHYVTAADCCCHP